MRMRTIDQAYTALKEADPDCALAKTALRRLVISGQIPSRRIGTGKCQKYLIDLDRLEEYLFSPEDPPVPPNVKQGEPRKLEVRA